MLDKPRRRSLRARAWPAAALLLLAAPAALAGMAPCADRSLQLTSPLAHSSSGHKHPTMRVLLTLGVLALVLGSAEARKKRRQKKEAKDSDTFCGHEQGGPNKGGPRGLCYEYLGLERGNFGKSLTEADINKMKGFGCRDEKAKDRKACEKGRDEGLKLAIGYMARATPTKKQLKAKYRQMSKDLHPDKGTKNCREKPWKLFSPSTWKAESEKAKVKRCSDEFASMGIAGQMLTNPVKRAFYDFCTDHPDFLPRKHAEDNNEQGFIYDTYAPEVNPLFAVMLCLGVFTVVSYLLQVGNYNRAFGQYKKMNLNKVAGEAATLATQNGTKAKDEASKLLKEKFDADLEAGDVDAEGMQRPSWYRTPAWWLVTSPKLLMAMISGDGAEEKKD